MTLKLIVKATKVTTHEIPEISETMYNITMFDDIVSGSTNTGFLIGRIFKYVIIEKIYMLVSLFCLMLVFL